MSVLYPLFLRLEGEKCLVVGGGNVAERKVLSLLESGAEVTVVSPKLSPVLSELKKQQKITHLEQQYSEEVLEDVFLVICATDVEEVNRAVAQDCFARKILVNVADDPPKCNFFVPSVVRQGNLSIAISTNGKSPLLARTIREQLEKVFGPEYGDFLEILGQVRMELLQNEPDPKRRRAVLERIVRSDILKLLREKRYDDIKERIENAYRDSRG